MTKISICFLEPHLPWMKFLYIPGCTYIEPKPEDLSNFPVIYEVEGVNKALDILVTGNVSMDGNTRKSRVKTNNSF